MRDLIFTGCWVILFPAAFLSAHIGVLLWIWIALSSPNLMLYNFLSAFPFNKIIAIVTFGVILLKPEKKDFYFDPILGFYCLFLVIACLSQFMSLNIYEFGEGTFEKVLKEFALFVVITGVMKSRHRIHGAVLAFCFGLAMTGAFEATAYIVSGAGHKVLGSGALGDNNGVAAAMLMATPLCYYMINYSEVRLTRIAFTILMFCNIITVMATFSRGGFLGLIVLALFLFANARQKMPIIISILVVGGVMLAVAPDAWFGRIDSINDTSSNMSFMGRVVAWKISLLGAMDRPFYGMGFHALMVPEVWYKYQPLVNTIGVIDTPEMPPYPLAAHSIFFEVLGDTGFIGFGAFCAILGTALLYCRAIIKRCKGRAELIWAVDLARLLQVTVIVYAAAGSAIPYAYFEGYWIVVAIISRLNHTTRQIVEPEMARAVEQRETDRKRLAIAN